MSRKGESIFKRKDGRYEARYISEYINGKAKYKYIYARSYQEVKRKRLKNMKSCTKATSVCCPSSFDEVSQMWLDSTKLSVRESTYSRYHRILTKYLLPKFSQYKLIDITQGLVSEFVCFLLASGGKSKSGLSPKTVSDILVVLRSIFKTAHKNQIICQDISDVKIFKSKNSRPKILNDDDFNKLKSALQISSSITSIGIELAMFTGIRIGELCGLKWGDIDFVNRTLKIERTVERIENEDSDECKTKIIISSPKSLMSVREIPIPDFILNKLKNVKSDNNFFILTNANKPNEPQNFYVKYQKYLKSIGIKHYTFHSLRHTFATKCVEVGFDTKSLSEILGHSNISVTLSLYVHPTLEQKRKQMQLLASYL